jgi:hypothetical protein
MKLPLLLALVLLAGCLAATPPPAAPSPTAQQLAQAFAVTTDHDHKDPKAHDLALGLQQVGGVPLAKLTGGDGGRASDVQFFGTLAAVAVNGGAGGFDLVDVSDPAHPTVVSRYRSGSEDNWYVKFSPDGKFVFLTANGNFNPTNAAATLQQDVTSQTATDAARGLQAIDVRDPKAPALAAVFPSPIRVINCYPVLVQGVTYVFATVVDDRSPVAAVPSPGVLQNYVSVLKFDASGATPTLTEVARWTPDKAGAGDTLTHDVYVEEHPLTHQRILYVGGWDSGAWLVDVTDPTAPKTLSHVTPYDVAQGAHTHTVKATTVGGKPVMLVSPETFAGAPSGRYHLYDTTDPTRPTEIASWALPGNLTNPEALLWSPHEFTLANGRAYTSNYHAGVWVLDLARGLAPVAAWDEAGVGWAPAPASEHWAVDSETAVWHEGYVYDVDMGQGLVVLKEAS